MLQSEFYMQDGGFALSDAGFAGGHEDNPAQHTCYQGNGGRGKLSRTHFVYSYWLY